MVFILFINPNSSAKIYQDLALTYSAIKPSNWALLLAQPCRVRGFEVASLDCDAKRLSSKSSLERIEEIKPWPDHLLAHWDSRVLDALLVAGIQEQPLLGFVPDKAWKSVCKLSQKPKTYRSVSESLPLRYKMVAFPSPVPKARKSRPSLGTAKNLLVGDLTVPSNRLNAMGGIR